MRMERESDHLESHRHGVKRVPPLERISSFFSPLTSLTMLFMNNLTGTIPSSFGNLSALTELGLYANNLHGAIPSELGTLTQIQDAYIYNRVVGSHSILFMEPPSPEVLVFVSKTPSQASFQLLSATRPLQRALFKKIVEMKMKMQMTKRRELQEKSKEE
eukprot:Gb_25523 [translate_table: standard]